TPSSSAVKVAEAPVAGRKLWKVLVPAAAILVAAAIGGAFYFRFSRSTARLTEKDTIVLADFTNTTGDAVFDDTLKTALNVSRRLLRRKCSTRWARRRPSCVANSASRWLLCRSSMSRWTRPQPPRLKP